MLELVGRLGGLHAQLMSSAELTLWARVRKLEPGALARALWEDRTLVKTWAMRGTLHVLPARELPMWQAALGTYRHYLKPSWLRAFGVTVEDLDAVLAAVADALDGQVLTRDELADAVAKRTGSAELGDKMRQSWGALLKPAAFRGLLCFAPNRGQRVCFTRPDSWLGRWETHDADHALAEVTRRFLAVNGPVTRDDFGRWLALAPAPAGKLIQQLGTEVAEVDVEGTRAWMLAGDVARARAASGLTSVRLLPAFDQWVIAATRHAERLMAGPFRSRVYRSQGWISPVLVVGGRIDGVWRHERSGRRLVVEISPFVEVPERARAGAEHEARRLVEFLGGVLDLRWCN